MRNLSEHQKGILYVFTAALLWSSGGLFIKLISFSAMQLSFFRCSIAAITFALIFKKQILLVNKLSIINSVIYAVVLISFVIATKTTTAANAIFLQATAPIYVLIFEPLINKTRYERINIITVGVCVLGMILFFVGKLEPGHLEGNLVALVSGITFAAFFLGMKRNDQKYQQSSIFWAELERQVRIEGKIKKISKTKSQKYFDTRPIESRLAAWASEQSSVVQDRDYLEKRFLKFKEQFKGKKIPMPKNWGGFILVPEYFEFWQGRESRLHDRICYKMQKEKWKIFRLAP